LNWGRPYLSDWADKADDDPVFGIYKKCGFMFEDEAAVLYQSAKQLRGLWLDIGCHTGWTALHVVHAGSAVIAIDPMLTNKEFHSRAETNIVRAGCFNQIRLLPQTSREFFGTTEFDVEIQGAVIDGEHSWGGPLYDAVCSFKRLAPDGAIVFHDFAGGPVREAVRYLMCEGMKCRVYFLSMQLLAVCWRGDFTPPDYEKPAGIDWDEYQNRFQAASGKYPNGRGDFYFEECM
jgi:SAM-dependent methyltransferase